MVYWTSFKQNYSENLVDALPNPFRILWAPYSIVVFDHIMELNNIAFGLVPTACYKLWSLVFHINNKLYWSHRKKDTERWRGRWWYAAVLGPEWPKPLGHLHLTSNSTITCLLFELTVYNRSCQRRKGRVMWLWKVYPVTGTPLAQFSSVLNAASETDRRQVERRSRGGVVVKEVALGPLSHPPGIDLQFACGRTRTQRRGPHDPAFSGLLSRGWMATSSELARDWRRGQSKCTLSNNCSRVDCRLVSAHLPAPPPPVGRSAVSGLGGALVVSRVQSCTRSGSIGCWMFTERVLCFNCF